ncbi:MAG: hypothetical protein FWF53_09300 [Candidatus Azobacteroides sp.]|nr:hypothetical protein [Candidatus Azobacteroides sp.]
MKRIYLWIFLLFACGNIFAQSNIVHYEYWLNNDYAHRTTATANSTEFNLSADIPTQEIEPGIHTFNVRFKDSYGRWSSPVSQYFQKLTSDIVLRNITAYEYWFNDDYGKKIRKDVAPQQTLILLDSVNRSSADKRINTISYRFLDDSGLWSSTFTADFYQTVTISVNLTYTKSVLPGETPVVETGYPDYADVGFTLYNITKEEDITDMTVQFPDIVLTLPVDAGDSIAITAIGYSTERINYFPWQKVRILTRFRICRLLLPPNW